MKRKVKYPTALFLNNIMLQLHLKDLSFPDNLMLNVLKFGALGVAIRLLENFTSRGWV